MESVPALVSTAVRAVFGAFHLTRGLTPPLACTLIYSRCRKSGERVDDDFSVLQKSNILMLDCRESREGFTASNGDDWHDHS